MRVSKQAAAEVAAEGVAVEVVEMERRVALEHLLEELLQEEERVLEQRAVLQGEAADLRELVLHAIVCFAVEAASRAASSSRRTSISMLCIFRPIHSIDCVVAARSSVRRARMSSCSFFCRPIIWSSKFVELREDGTGISNQCG